MNRQVRLNQLTDLLIASLNFSKKLACSSHLETFWIKLEQTLVLKKFNVLDKIFHSTIMSDESPSSYNNFVIYFSISLLSNNSFVNQKEDFFFWVAIDKIMLILLFVDSFFIHSYVNNKNLRQQLT